MAIELAFDSASDQRLGLLWSRLSALYAGPTESELGVRPHITLALFRGGEPRDLPGLLESLAGELACFGLTLGTVGRFPGSEGVVFLRPEVSAERARAHTILHELLAKERDLVHAYYRPGTWHPHCTMAINVPDALIDAVLTACRCPEALGEVGVARIQAVRYRPATEIGGAWLEQRQTV